MPGRTHNFSNLLLQFNNFVLESLIQLLDVLNALGLCLELPQRLLGKIPPNATLDQDDLSQFLLIDEALSESSVVSLHHNGCLDLPQMKGFSSCQIPSSLALESKDQCLDLEELPPCNKPTPVLLNDYCRTSLSQIICLPPCQHSSTIALESVGSSHELLITISVQPTTNQLLDNESTLLKLLGTILFHEGHLSSTEEYFGLPVAVCIRILKVSHRTLVKIFAFGSYTNIINTYFRKAARSIT
jgi:hypothetical protein